MVDRYAKFATENLAFAASRIETEKDRKVIKDANQSYKPANFELIGSPTRARTWDLRINSPSLYRLSYQGTDKEVDVNVLMLIGQYHITL